MFTLRSLQRWLSTGGGIGKAGCEERLFPIIPNLPHHHHHHPHHQGRHHHCYTTPARPYSFPLLIPSLAPTLSLPSAFSSLPQSLPPLSTTQSPNIFALVSPRPLMSDPDPQLFQTETRKPGRLLIRYQPKPFLVVEGTELNVERGHGGELPEALGCSASRLLSGFQSALKIRDGDMPLSHFILPGISEIEVVVLKKNRVKKKQVKKNQVEKEQVEKNKQVNKNKQVKNNQVEKNKQVKKDKQVEKKSGGNKYAGGKKSGGKKSGGKK